jgi:hypothetical protein
MFGSNRPVWSYLHQALGRDPSRHRRAPLTHELVAMSVLDIGADEPRW